MLVLTRGPEEDICIGADVRVRVLSVHGSQVRLGVTAPAHVTIYRAELLEAVQQENAAATQMAPASLAGLRRAADIVRR